MRGGTSRGVFFRGDDLLPWLLLEEQQQQQKQQKPPSSWLLEKQQKPPMVPSSSFNLDSRGCAVNHHPNAANPHPNPILLDAILKDVMGSPDIRQIDGLGGADVLTSKVAVISKSDRDDADVDYLFGQVEIQYNNNGDNDGDSDNDNDGGGCDGSRVLYDVNCGNISAAVGPFAIDEGMLLDDVVVVVVGDDNDGHSDNSNGIRHRKVRIYNVNTRTIIVAKVPVDATTGRSAIDRGDYIIDGVPGSAAKIDLDFSATVGTLNGMLLPTGNRKDIIHIVDDDDDDNDNHDDDDDNGGRGGHNNYYEISFVDVANPVVHINGLQLGLKGDEPAKAILENAALWKKVEQIRHAAAKLVLPDHEITPTKPFAAVVLPGCYDYMTLGGKTVQRAGSADVRSHVFFCGSPHKAYPGTASNATAAAAMIQGTVVHDMVLMGNAQMNDNNRDNDIVSIGHPSGCFHVEIELEDDGGNDDVGQQQPVLKKSIIGRTARRIMDGNVYLKPATVDLLLRRSHHHHDHEQ